MDDEIEADVSEVDVMERLRRYGEQLARQTDDPLMREKIYTALSGRSVNH